MPAEENRASEKGKIRNGIKHLILCEGKDEYYFLIYYLNSEALLDQPELSKTVQVEDFGGNDELLTKLLLWSKAPGFENLKTLIVIRDAESDASSSAQKIIHAFKESGLPAPSCPHQFACSDSLKTGFLLFPECSSTQVNGTLEDLCLSILNENEEEVLGLVDSFLSSIEEQHIRTFPRRFKAQLHTYLSITDKYVSLKVGEAAKAGAFNWKSPCLNSIKGFLTEML